MECFMEVLQVQVADVDWIKIVSGEQISLMEGQSQPIHLMAGINDGNAFDSHQYAYMKIHVHIEDPIVELVDKNGMPSDAGGYINAPNFTISAKDLGFTTLYVSVRQQSGHEILSQSIKIEVYAPLRIHPVDIFLVPGACYMLAMKGGPTIGVYFQYASMDDGIATVDKSSGRLCAISPGNATILSTVFGNGRVVVCQAHGRINVGVPSLSMLSAQSNKLDVGREMPIYPSFPEGDLFSFYELCRSYKWTIEDEKVLSFNMAESLNVEKHWFPLDDEQELDFIKVLHGRSAGKANITVTFSCDFISASYSQSRLYDATLSLLVVPPLPLDLGGPMTWLLPPHYATSSLLPSSLESHGQRDGQGRRGTIIYSLLSSEKNEVWKKDAISIDGDRIKTTESNNLACIQAKDRTTGRTGIASCVRVAEVAQIRIMKRDPPFHAIYLAVGANLDLPISYFDASGNPFYEAHDVISYHAETNYHEIVSIVHTRNGNGNIHLKAMQTGRALVRVSMNSNPLKFDYILVSVGAHLHPQNPVLQHGSSLNFSIIGIDDQVSCCWHSANERVVSVDMRSGKAEACGIGSTHVFFESPRMKLQTAITVLSGNIVSINAPKEILTNIPYPAKGYSFPLSLSDPYNKLETLGNGKGVSYDCKVDPPFVGYAKPWMDLESGNSYCLFFPYSPEHLVHSVPRLKDMRPYVSISINVSLGEASHVSGSASAIFVGGFSILEMDKSSMQLNLTPDSNKTIITILGNTDVEIHWLDRDSMKITLIHKEDFGIGGRAQYEVEVLRAKRLKDRIIITLPANGQRIEILVTYEPDAETGVKTSFATVIGLLIAGCVILCVIYLIVVPCFISEISNKYVLSTTPCHPT
ncbi:NUCLEAR PORE MEMBRANE GLYCOPROTEIN 210 [Salix koriyanagi]|uniref:NUCLEAR PORE MEMBRANE GLYCOPROTEIN 210 n=1 Tax=Salix koriyanagi TaxID=2511006 RepID=A0A9Q0WYA9_9ROSI|nr:NUCLEAR PORE MEMBRANE GLYCOPROTEIN 210 [Salix koriyanagi]